MRPVRSFRLSDYPNGKHLPKQVQVSSSQIDFVPRSSHNIIAATPDHYGKVPRSCLMRGFLQAHIRTRS